MPNVTFSPNMTLGIPGVGLDPGPDWANVLNNNFLSIVDQHDHSQGKGVPVTPSGLNINADLTFANNDATNVRSVRLFAQNSPLAGAAPDLGCIYRSGVDLYYNDGNGNQVRLTQSGAVSGSAGTITGLPSGTASAAYAAAQGNFIFEQATATAANIDAGTLIVRYPGSYPTPSGNYISLQAPATLATGYALTLPTALPASSGALLTASNAGAVSYTNVDNSTLSIAAGVLKVPTKGITTTQISSGISSANSYLVSDGLGGVSFSSPTWTRTIFYATGNWVCPAGGI